MLTRPINRKDIIRDTYFFSGSVYISQAMFFIRGFLNARILGPGLYGLWSGLNIILSYSAYSHMGGLSAMNREIPFQKGRDSLGDMDRARNAAFTMTLITGGMFSVVLIIAAFLLWGRLSNAEACGLIAISLLGFVSILYEFCQTSLISFKRFLVVSKGNIVFSILSVIATLILLPLFNIYGVYLTAVSIPLLNLAYLWLKEHYSPKLCMDFKEMLRLIKIGFPIMSIDFLETTITNASGIVVLFMLGNVNFAYFSVAMLAARFLMYFPKSVNRTFEPHIYQSYGETGRIGDLKKYLIKPTQVMAMLFPLLIAASYIAAAFFIRHFLPKYTPAVLPLFIILISRFFVSFSPTSIAFITAINKQKFLVPVYIFGIAIAAGLSFIFIKMGLDVTGAAFAFLTASFFTGSVIFLYAVSKLTKNVLEAIGYLALSCGALLYTLAVIMFNEAVVLNSQDIFSDMLALTAKLGLLFIFGLPLIYIANKKTKIISDMFNITKINRHCEGEARSNL